MAFLGLDERKLVEEAAKRLPQLLDDAEARIKRILNGCTITITTGGTNEEIRIARADEPDTAERGGPA